MYLWIVFAHAFCVILFLLTHGASHSILFRIRNERKPERLRALLELSTSTYNLMFAALALVLVFGIAAGVAGSWWGQGWIWAALVLYVVVGAAMYFLAQKSFGPLRRALGTAVFAGEKTQPPSSAASDDEIAAIAAAVQTLPNTIAGIGGLAVLMWLMIFKPF